MQRHSTPNPLQLPLVFEEWRPIPGYEGYYEASNVGRIKSITHLKKNKQVHHGQMRRYYITNAGYLCVDLYGQQGHKKATVHSLIALTYLGNPPNSYEVNHRDGNKLNNNINNLEYVTRSQNVKHAISHKLFKPNIPKGSKHGMAKLTESQVRAIRQSILPYHLLAIQYNISRSTIERVREHKGWLHI